MKERKIVMLMVVREDCPWCKKMARKTLTKKPVMAFIDKNFVPVIMYRDRDKKKFPIDYQTPRVPAIFYINPKGHEVWTSIGYRNVEDLLYDFDEANQGYIEEITGVEH